MNVDSPQLTKAGYRIPEWAQSAGISRAHLYNLARENWPECVMIGSRRVIIESPTAWLQRMAALGGVVVPQRNAA